MANANSNTDVRHDFTSTPSIFDLEITALLELPVSPALDLFQILDRCQCYVDALIENDSTTERMALCGRLFAGLEVLKLVLEQPLPDYLVVQLTVDEGQPCGAVNPLTADSDMLCGYCSALTLVLLSQQQPTDLSDQLIEMLYDMLHVLADDLKAPRFIRTSHGLAMIDGEALLQVH
jgi:hypothetical protein